MMEHIPGGREEQQARADADHETKIAALQSAEVGTKRCPKCERVLPIESFAKSDATPSGREYCCKECKRAYHADYNRTHRDRIRASRKLAEQAGGGEGGTFEVVGELVQGFNARETLGAEPGELVMIWEGDDSLMESEIRIADAFEKGLKRRIVYGRKDLLLGLAGKIGIVFVLDPGQRNRAWGAVEELGLKIPVVFLCDAAASAS